MKLKYYKELAELHGASGNEFEIREYMKMRLSKADEIIRDKLGGIFGVYKGKGPKIMICAHMDEVGAIVRDIRKDGLIKIGGLGRINPESFISCCVYVTIAPYKRIKGIVCSTPPHISSKNNTVDFDDLLVDVGADSKEHAIEMGIKVGDFITPVDNFFVTNDQKKMVCKGFDDRIGCGLVAEIAHEMPSIRHNNTVILGGTVQEEVGLRGAYVASRLVNPDLFITIDVSPASDYLSKPEEGKIGGGFLIRYYDPTNIMQPNLLNYFKGLSKKINYQEFKSQGGTDAGAAQYANNGTLATTVGIPGRYIHSPYTMVSIEDIETTKKFITKLIRKFDAEALKKIKGKK